MITRAGSRRRRENARKKRNKQAGVMGGTQSGDYSPSQSSFSQAFGNTNSVSDSVVLDATALSMQFGGTGNQRQILGAMNQQRRASNCHRQSVSDSSVLLGATASSMQLGGIGNQRQSLSVTWESNNNQPRRVSASNTAASQSNFGATPSQSTAGEVSGQRSPARSPAEKQLQGGGGAAAAAFLGSIMAANARNSPGADAPMEASLAANSQLQNIYLSQKEVFWIDTLTRFGEMTDEKAEEYAALFKAKDIPFPSHDASCFMNSSLLRKGLGINNPIDILAIVKAVKKLPVGYCQHHNDNADAEGNDASGLWGQGAGADVRTQPWFGNGGPTSGADFGAMHQQPTREGALDRLRENLLQSGFYDGSASQNNKEKKDNLSQSGQQLSGDSTFGKQTSGAGGGSSSGYTIPFHEDATEVFFKLFASAPEVEGSRVGAATRSRSGFGDDLEEGDDNLKNDFEDLEVCEKFNHKYQYEPTYVWMDLLGKDYPDPDIKEDSDDHLDLHGDEANPLALPSVETIRGRRKKLRDRADEKERTRKKKEQEDKSEYDLYFRYMCSELDGLFHGGNTFGSQNRGHASLEFSERNPLLSTMTFDHNGKKVKASRAGDGSSEGSSSSDAEYEVGTSIIKGPASRLLQKFEVKKLPLPEFSRDRSVPACCAFVLRACTLDADVEEDTVRGLTNRWTVYVDCLNGVVATVHRVDSMGMAMLRGYLDSKGYKDELNTQDQTQQLRLEDFLSQLIELFIDDYEKAVALSAYWLDRCEALILKAAAGKQGNVSKGTSRKPDSRSNPSSRRGSVIGGTTSKEENRKLEKLTTATTPGEANTRGGKKRKSFVNFLSDATGTLGQSNDVDDVASPQGGHHLGAGLGATASGLEAHHNSSLEGRSFGSTWKSESIPIPSEDNQIPGNGQHNTNKSSGAEGGGKRSSPSAEEESDTNVAGAGGSSDAQQTVNSSSPESHNHVIAEDLSQEELLVRLFKLQRRATIYDRMIQMSRKILVDDLFKQTHVSNTDRLLRRFDKVHESVISVRVRAQTLLELHISITTFHTSKLVSVLTITSIMFVPVTFLCTLWGMNFKNMPELNHSWTYFVALPFLLFIAVSSFSAMQVFFHRGVLHKPTRKIK